VNDSYPLGRIFGIKVGVNWSVLLLLALIVWSLATSWFPDSNPGLGDNTYFVMAVLTAFGFFGSILLHELGHAVQATRDGMTIDGITLWLFGGVARFTGMFPTAGAEFRIAVAGPLVSLALGGGFLGIAAVPGLPSSVDGICAYLGFTNMALLLFNLLPALPLDGGRILRAALWQWRGDLYAATRIAAGAGRVLAIGMIGLGIAMFVFTDSAFNGLWLAVIGWFVLQAAGAEARMLTPSPAQGARVGDVLVRDPVTAPADLPLDRFVERTVWNQRHEAYPVVFDDRAVGLLELRRLADVAREDWPTTRVADLMIPMERVPELREDQDMLEAVDVLRAAGAAHGLVLDGQRLLGMLSLSDVARALNAGRPGRPSVPA
jgi:Zn-dependent protease/CBS domain-containing protein